MNKVCLIGNLTRAPETRWSTGQNQMAICRFNIGINEGRGENQKASFPSIVAFGKTAEACDKYLKKGSKVGIEGHIQTGSYDHKDGYKVYTTDVIADRVDFLTPAEKKQTDQYGGFYPTDDELPFE